MKTLLSLFIGIQMMGHMAMAQAVATPKPDVVLEVLKSSRRTVNFKVEASSYNKNILAYGCWWPGLNIPRSILKADLNHRGGFSWGNDNSGRNIAIGIKNANGNKCDVPRGDQDVFGIDFIVDTILPMKIDQTLAFVQRDRWDEATSSYKPVRLLRETITVFLSGRELETIAYIHSLNP